MLRGVLSLLRLPGDVALNALQTATSPSAINTLSLAIAQGSIQTAKQNQNVEIEGLTVDIDFNRNDF